MRFTTKEIDRALDAAASIHGMKDWRLTCRSIREVRRGMRAAASALLVDLNVVRKVNTVHKPVTNAKSGHRRKRS